MRRAYTASTVHTRFPPSLTAICTSAMPNRSALISELQEFGCATFASMTPIPQRKIRIRLAFRKIFVGLDLMGKREFYASDFHQFYDCIRCKAIKACVLTLPRKRSASKGAPLPEPERADHTETVPWTRIWTFLNGCEKANLRTDQMCFERKSIWHPQI